LPRELFGPESLNLATHYLDIDNGGGDPHESFSMLSVVENGARHPEWRT
jgi:hypothetical protein